MDHQSEETVFEPLAWDTELFGFPVARLISRDVSKAAAQMKEFGIRLAYASVPMHDSEARAKLTGAGALLVDRRLRFRKDLTAPLRMPEGAESWSGRASTPDLEELALASGHLSRFRVDPRIPSEVFRTLYLTWIRRSLSGEIADEVLVIEADRVAKAMVTLGKSTNFGAVGTIGLLAVAAGARGRGYGKRLIAAAEAWCVSHGATALEVVTQGRNTEACALYASSGCNVVADDVVYHLWLGQ